jgi:hypothetical protein
MAKRRAKNRRKRMSQGELFASVGLFPVRKKAGGRVDDLDVRSLRLRAAMTRAIRECGLSRDVIALQIAELTGRKLTRQALDTYTAGSKPEHDISLMRFIALVRVTRATWLWDELIAEEGLIVFEGEEAKLAERGYLEQERRRLDKIIKQLDRELGVAPVTVKSRGR